MNSLHANSTEIHNNITKGSLELKSEKSQRFHPPRVFNSCLEGEKAENLQN
jgi:hypothetical protein